jgi:hypothetical protein
MPSYRYPEPLAEHHDLSGFRCHSSERTDWLLRYARQSAATGTTRVFVVTEHGANHVIAYYAWCMAQVHPEAAPVRVRKGPVATLSRSLFWPGSASMSATRATGSGQASSKTSLPGWSSYPTTSAAGVCWYTLNPNKLGTSTSTWCPSLNRALQTTCILSYS